jgi:hypothetical protein
VPDEEVMSVEGGKHVWLGNDCLAMRRAMSGEETRTW